MVHGVVTEPAVPQKLRGPGKAAAQVIGSMGIGAYGDQLGSSTVESRKNRYRPHKACIFLSNFFVFMLHVLHVCGILFMR